MSLTNTEAFVLKGFRYRDTSKIVTLFTTDYGKFNAIVKGARNFKSKFCGIFENIKTTEIYNLLQKLSS
jgi:DNA repair protein RecO (recombination protein O)